MTDALRRAPVQGASPDEEAQLWRELRAGSTAAREALFQLYAPFARGLAVRRRRAWPASDVEFDDLKQLAYAGLLEALGRFDPERGAPFRAFAARRISGSIADGVGQMSEMREQLSYRRRIRRERADTLTADQDGGTSAADDLNQLAELAAGLAIGFLLDAGLVQPPDAADTRPNAYEGLGWRQTLRRVVVEVRALPPRERTIIERHYGDGLDFERIGRLLGVSKGRVSQLHKTAIQRLRQAMAAMDAVF